MPKCDVLFGLRGGTSRTNFEYQQIRCLKYKGSSKSSKENKIISLPMPPKLQCLMQCEAVLIARAFTVMQEHFLICKYI